MRNGVDQLSVQAELVSLLFCLKANRSEGIGVLRPCSRPPTPIDHPSAHLYAETRHEGLEVEFDRGSEGFFCGGLQTESCPRKELLYERGKSMGGSRGG